LGSLKVKGDSVGLPHPVSYDNGELIMETSGWEGGHEYTYFAQATTPGLFVVPPTKAEEMYSPETFGRGKSDRVRVR
jgi:hypothetical protein